MAYLDVNQCVQYVVPHSFRHRCSRLIMSQRKKLAEHVGEKSQAYKCKLQSVDGGLTGRRSAFCVVSIASWINLNCGVFTWSRGSKKVME
jgi:hypothetical protein